MNKKIKKEWKKVEKISQVSDSISLFQEYLDDLNDKELVKAIENSKQNIIVTRIQGEDGVIFLKFFLDLEEHELRKRLNEDT